MIRDISIESGIVTEYSLHTQNSHFVRLIKVTVLCMLVLTQISKEYEHGVRN